MNHTLEELEVQLREALDVGDPDQIGPLAREVDQRHRAADAVTVLASALYYAEQGLHVFPLSPGSKIPHRGTRGCKDATSDEDTIRGWWERWPDSNVGVATGHLVDVVDIDGAAGQQSRADNARLFSSLDVIGKVDTPRTGGEHLYVPANPEVGNGAGLLPNVDYRGRGGYVVAPPSRTDVGIYRWTVPLEVTL